MVDTRISRLGSDIKKNTNIWIQAPRKSIKEPSMGIDLFLILLFECKDNLYGDDTAFCAFVSKIWGYRYLSCVFVDLSNTSSLNVRTDIHIKNFQLLYGKSYMACDRFSIDDIFGDTILVDTLGSQYRQSPRIDLLPPVRNNHDDHLIRKSYKACRNLAH